MTLAEWQSSPKLISAWREMTNSEVFLHALSVLEEIGPVQYSVLHNADHANRNSPTLLGQIQGHVQTMKNIAMLAKAPLEPAKQPKTLYGAVPETE